MPWVFSLVVNLFSYFVVIKQIFHAFLFNIRNYSSGVINIQRREAELNIILPRVNNFSIKQKKVWNICFIIWHQHQTRSGRIKTNKTQQISVKTQVFFVKIEVRHIKLQLLVNHFILFLLIFFSEVISPWKKIFRIRIFVTWNRQLIRDWCKIKQENMIHIYDITIIDVTGVQWFPVI